MTSNSNDLEPLRNARPALLVVGRHPLSDPRLVLSPGLAIRAYRIGDVGCRPRPDGLHLDGDVVYAMWDCRLMDQRLAPDFIQQMTRRYGIGTLIQIAAVPVVVVAPRLGVAIALLCVAWNALGARLHRA